MKAPRNNNPIPNQPFASNDLPTLKGPYWDVALGSGLGLGSGGNAVTSQGGGGGGSLPAHFPPYNCETDVDTAGITLFNYAWGGCYSLTSFPGTLNLSSGTNFYYAWGGCPNLTSFPGDLDLSSGTNFGGSWDNCTGLTSFPETLDLSSGTNFYYAWVNCTGLTFFPAGMFDSCSTSYNEAFRYAWQNCALNQQSVNNILISLDTSGIVNNYVSIDGGTSAAPSGAGAAAKTSLQGKGWTVVTN